MVLRREEPHRVAATRRKSSHWRDKRVKCIALTMSSDRKGNQKRAAMASVDPDDYVDGPSNTDVVLGRGSAQAWRPGNVRFHNYLDQIFPRYQSARTKRAKRAIVQEIYDHITASGSFLESEQSGERYIIIEEDEAKEKIGYAIRYRKKRILKAEAELARRIEEEDTQRAEAATAVAAEDEEESKIAAVPARESRPGTRVADAPAREPSANAAAATGEISLFSDEDLASVLFGARQQEQQPAKRQRPSG